MLLEDLRSRGANPATPVDDATVRSDFRGVIATLRAIEILGSAGIVVGHSTDTLPDLDRLLASVDHGLLGVLDCGSPLRFRVELRDAAHRRKVIDAIKVATGWINDPADWTVNILRRAGVWIAEVGELHYSRRFGRLRRQPWSTNPVLAAVLVRLAKLNSGQLVHDPFCGTGTLLIAAHRAYETLRITGTDHDRRTLEMARGNLDDHQVAATVTSTAALPFPHPDHSVDRVVSNVPFGKQVGNHGDNVILYPRLMTEIARTLRPDGRAVLLTEDKRLLVESVARTPGLKIIRERLLRYSGASPTAYVIMRTRTVRHRRR
ncbi:TRM11 family SAM-dependent methyltransferase [Microlunatus endophyticus]|uniref:TRM11 family SAM-dependent methyltransferase n=1 Tax=Microlunatus endophyticus TaxID=1716077 RepID=UPI0016662BE9|nr:methyltransferase [Microlunatus endophyticus]